MSMIFSNLERDYDRKYSDWELLKRYSRYLKEQKTHLYYTLIAIFAGTGLTLLLPFVLQRAVDDLLNDRSDEVIKYAFAFLGLYIAVWIADFIRNYENTKFTTKSTRSIRNDLFVQVQDHDMTFFDHNNTGSIMSRINDDVQILGDFVKMTSDFLVNVAIAIGTAIILLTLDLRLTLLAMSVIPFLFLIAITFRKIARKLSREWRVTISELNESFLENISGISVARSFGREETARNNFDELNRKNYRVNVKRSIFFSSIFPFVFACSNIGLFLILFNGGIQSVKTGQPTPGELIMYVVMLQRFYFPIVLMTTYWQQVQAGFAAAERIFSLQDVETKVKDSGKIQADELQGKIEFRNLNFSYNDKNPVFQGFNLHIPAGQTIAIVGHTGAGKSSLISLLARFYEFQEGEILIDEVSIKDYKLASYRSGLGLVLQEPLLFSGSIRNNIAYGNANASEEEVLLAAKAANAWEFIKNTSEGMDTNILERGKKISQGQKQLISIARAFLVNPRILLLDEATASIDAYSEALIQEAIYGLLKDRTSIIIAHRLTTVKKADLIIVLDKGEIVEEGTHEELLELKGHYSDLYQKYFAFQEVEIN